ncbi:Vms1/Ankzf1 family peptidyl-tRNA hydrolase [Leucobacter sp. USCH14]|uniref:baeRF2 domain-containing protein n=1 Tax=Leucobacter sp. USCH14 TaxID=3024838 RepID=UPI0030B62234
MTIGKDLRNAVQTPGSWTTAYTDGTSDEPQTVEEAREGRTLRQLADRGAPEGDVDAIRDVLQERTGGANPTTLFLLAHNGEIVVREEFVGPRHGPEVFEHGPLPVLVPLLRHRGKMLRYLVVETSRDGADVCLEIAGQRDGTTSERVEGRTDSLPKVQAGGWSQPRWQRHSEEIWKHTQSEVAEVVERLTREASPAFIALAGDVRARQLLRDQLSPESAKLVVEVDANTRADGSDDSALREAIEHALDDVFAREMSGAIDATQAEGGRLRAEGVDAVVAALQQAQVSQLFLDARMIAAPSDDDVATLGALDAEPWVAADGAAFEAATEIARQPVAEALARAAVLTDAHVRICEDEPEADDAVREERDARPPFALLRW